MEMLFSKFTMFDYTIYDSLCYKTEFQNYAKSFVIGEFFLFYVYLFLLFLKPDAYKLSYEAIKASQITASSDYHRIVSRFKTCFNKDPRIKIENIYKWGFRLFIEEDISK